MSSPSTVLTLGFGSWGSVNLLPTIGYGVGAAAEVFPNLAFTLDNERLEFTLTEAASDEFTLED